MNSNLYITTAEFKAFQRVTNTDAADDAVIDSIINSVSRFIEGYTGRRFFPVIETHLFDIPDFTNPERDQIYLDDDLLSLTTLTNGDATVITSADYLLKPANKTPYWAVKIRNMSNVTWEPDSNGSGEQALSVNGLWGYHDDYQHAWVLGGTLGAAITTTSTLSATMTAGHTLASQQIWKIDNEILQGSVSTNTLTFNVRGDNGSTAATHLIGASVYIWQPIQAVTIAAQQIVNSFYKKRFGENVTSATAMITGMGVVLSPKDIPDSALRLLQPLVRLS